jgi:hypothetical protein
LQGTLNYSRYRQLERPDLNKENLSDFWMLIPICICLRLLRTIIASSGERFFSRVLSKKYSGIELEKKIVKAGKSIFKIVYFSFTVFIGMNVLYDTNFSDPSMFGDGVTRYTLGNWPYTAIPYLMKFHYMLCLSYYVEDGIVHLTQTPDYDFWEMTLHHIVTGMLIFISYMTGFWILGVKVLIQMDFEDIWVGLSRFNHDFARSFVTITTFFIMVVSWAYFRFYVFWVTVMDFSFAGKLSVDNQ